MISNINPGNTSFNKYFFFFSYADSLLGFKLVHVLLFIFNLKFNIIDEKVRA